MITNSFGMKKNRIRKNSASTLEFGEYPWRCKNINTVKARKRITGSIEVRVLQWLDLGHEGEDVVPP